MTCSDPAGSRGAPRGAPHGESPAAACSDTSMTSGSAGVDGHPRWGREAGYLRMLTARAMTSAARAIDPAASSIIRSLAHGLMAEVSVGLTAVAVQKASDR